MQHQQMQDVQAMIATAAASGGLASHLASFNEVLTMIATLIAIASGGWVLYDKWRERRGLNKEDKKDGS